MTSSYDVVSSSLNNMVDKLLDDFFKFHDIKVPQHLVKDSRYRYPKMDICEFDDRYEIECAVPGLTKEQVSVNYDGGVLYIKGKKWDRSEAEDCRVIMKELHKSSFTRAINVSNVDVDDIACSLKNGVLKIVLPKKNKNRVIPVKIEISD